MRNEELLLVRDSRVHHNDHFGKSGYDDFYDRRRGDNVPTYNLLVLHMAFVE